MNEFNYDEYIFSTLQIDMNGHPFNSLEKTGTIM